MGWRHYLLKNGTGLDVFKRDYGSLLTRIVGWAIDKRMSADLVIKSLKQAYWLRRHPRGVIFHSDRGWQYTSIQINRETKKMGITQSMGDVGVGWVSAVVKGFFGSLKQDWLFKLYYVHY